MLAQPRPTSLQNRATSMRFVVMTQDQSWTVAEWFLAWVQATLGSTKPGPTLTTDVQVAL